MTDAKTFKLRIAQIKENEVCMFLKGSHLGKAFGKIIDIKSFCINNTKDRKIGMLIENIEKGENTVEDKIIFGYHIICFMQQLENHSLEEIDECFNMLVGMLGYGKWENVCLALKERKNKQDLVYAFALDFVEIFEIKMIGGNANDFIETVKTGLFNSNGNLWTELILHCLNPSGSLRPSVDELRSNYQAIMKSLKYQLFLIPSEDNDFLLEVYSQYVGKNAKGIDAENNILALYLTM